ncbi:MAG: CBS domain-containing protein [Nitrolancea sp.]
MEEATTIGQIMTPAQDVIQHTEGVRMARRRLQSESKRSLIVVEEDVPVGVLEWRRIMHIDGDDSDAPVSEVMSKSLPELTSEMTVAEAGGRLTDVDVETLPVVDESGHLIGEVSRTAISKHHEVTNETQMTAEPTMTGDASKYASVTNGMTVTGSSGSKIGEVTDLVVAKGGQLDAITVSHGLFGRKHKRVSADLIESVGDDQLTLVIDQPEFKALPDLEQVEERA